MVPIDQMNLILILILIILFIFYVIEQQPHSKKLDNYSKIIVRSQKM